MTERAALVAAIEADPENDLPRLVWADWLDDHGEPERAELIRVQCEMARSPSAKLRGQERAALNALGRVWRLTGPRSRWPFDGGFRGLQLRDLFERGCLTNFPLTADGDFHRNVERYAGREPLIHLWLHTGSSEAWGRVSPRAAASPHLRRVIWLEGGRPKASLLRSPYLTGLRYLVDARPDDLLPLRTEPAGANLLWLWFAFLTTTGDVSAREVDPLAVARRVADNPRFVSLRQLRFSFGPLGEAAVRALVASPYLSPELELSLPYEDQYRRGSPLARALKERFPGPPAVS